MENMVAFFQDFQSGNIEMVRDRLGQLDLSSLISGHPDFSGELAAKLRDSGLINQIQSRDAKGDTALHLAVREDLVDLVKILVDLDASLCNCANNKGETPLKLAVSFGFDEAVELLISHTSYALHCIVELNQVELVEYLIEKDKLKQERDRELPKRINEAVQPPDMDAQQDHPIVVIGDTPLHIAARNKFDHMVSLLLKVDGVKKHAVNSEDKTAFDIAREVTEYKDSFRSIRRLRDSRREPKRFMYCSPQASHQKYKRALEATNKAYEERRGAELVVAALLAGMTCSALFTVPGGFVSESPEKGSPSQLYDDQASPLLISLVPFKLFIIFDCIAFFLSLFVCIMWEMSSELTIKDKMGFMSAISLLVCLSFGFSASGFMCAVYAMLARKVKTFSWLVLGSLIFITLCGVLAFLHQFVTFVVKRARVHRLCGVSSEFDEIVERVWYRAELCGLLELCRSVDDFLQGIFRGHCKLFKANKGNDSSRNSHSSTSCCFNRV